MISERAKNSGQSRIPIERILVVIVVMTLPIFAYLIELIDATGFRFWMIHSVLGLVVLHVLTLVSWSGDWFEPPRFLAGLYFLYFVITPALIIIYPELANVRRYFRQTTTNFPMEFWWISLSNLVAFSLFLTGYRLPIGKRLGSAIPELELRNTDIVPTILAIFMGLGLFSYLTYVAVVGGFEYMITHQYERAQWGEVASTVLPGLVGWFYWGAKLLWWVPILAVAFGYDQRHRWLVRIIILLILLLFWVWGGRGAILIPLVLIFLLRSDKKLKPFSIIRQRRNLIIASSLLGISLVVLSIVLGLFRATGGFRSAIRSDLDVRVTLHGFIAGFTRIDVIMLATDIVPERSPYLMGDTFLLPIKVILNEVGIPIRNYFSAPGFLTTALYGFDIKITGIGAPLLAELYINFGWLGILGFGLLGILSKVMYTYKRNHIHNPLVQISYYYWTVVLLWNVVFTSGFSGAFHKAMIGFGLMFIPLLLFTRRRRAYLSP